LIAPRPLRYDAMVGSVAIEETAAALKQLLDEGKIRA
jgi:aryl-alcohol dehydrogenase-like predicted oxidoreductase